MTLEERDLLDAIRISLPGVEIRSVREMVEGWDFLVLDVNGQWIFRFPRREACVETLKSEVLLLAELDGELPIPVPRYELAYVDCDWQQSFGAYQKLPGVSSRHTGRPDDPVAGARLGAFLASLHALPVERFSSLQSWSAEGWRQRFQRTHEALPEKVLPLLSASEGARLLDEFARGLAQIDAFEPVLVHGDLNTDNLLINPQQGLVSAVIDWGDACVGDPAIDFAWPVRSWGDGFAAEMVGAYGVTDSRLLDRASFYALVACCDDIIYGPNFGEQWLGEGLRSLQTML